MSLIGPLGTWAGLLQRSRGLFEVYLRDEPNVVGYQFWGADTLANAYAAPVAMFQVNRGLTFRSANIRRKGWGRLDESRRGTTRAVFDIEDFTAPGVALPNDNGTLWLRVQENRSGVGLLDFGLPANPVLGPAYLIPPPTFFGSYGPGFGFNGNAPAGTTSAAGAPPVLDESGAAPLPFYVVLPAPASVLNIQNQHNAVNLLVATGPGHPMFVVPPGDIMNIAEGTAGVRELIFASADAAVAVPFGVNGAASREK